MKRLILGTLGLIALLSLSLVDIRAAHADDTTSKDIIDGIIPGGRCACPYVRRECHDLSNPVDRARFEQVCKSGAGACTDQPTCTTHLTKDLCDSLPWLPEWSPGRPIPSEPISETFCLFAHEVVHACYPGGSGRCGKEDSALDWHRYCAQAGAQADCKDPASLKFPRKLAAFES